MYNQSHTPGPKYQRLVIVLRPHTHSRASKFAPSPCTLFPLFWSHTGFYSCPAFIFTVVCLRAHTAGVPCLLLHQHPATGTPHVPEPRPIADDIRIWCTSLDILCSHDKLVYLARITVSHYKVVYLAAVPTVIKTLCTSAKYLQSLGDGLPCQYAHRNH